MCPAGRAGPGSPSACPATQVRRSADPTLVLLEHGRSTLGDMSASASWAATARLVRRAPCAVRRAPCGVRSERDGRGRRRAGRCQRVAEAGAVRGSRRRPGRRRNTGSEPHCVGPSREGRDEGSPPSAEPADHRGERTARHLVAPAEDRRPQPAGSQIARPGKMGAGCPPLTGHCSGRVLRDARTGGRLLTCSVPVGGSPIGTSLTT